mgnify:CR=1 FL=1
MNNVNVNTLILEYQPILQNLAKRFTKDQEAINDLVQDTFIKSLRYVDQFFHNPKIIPWLFVIMKNIYINQYKRIQNYQKYDKLFQNYLQQTSYSQIFGEKVPEQKMMIADVYHVLETLPESHTNLFKDYINGYKYRELSEMYQLPEGTIKSRIHVIRKTLIKKLNLN